MVSSIWNYIEPWIDKRQFAFTTYAVLAGSWLLYITITKDKVASPTDLRLVEGILSNYSFLDKEKGTKQYYLWLNKTSSTFQIPADFLPLFEKSTFEKEAIIGQKISLKISKHEEENLKVPYSRILVYDLQQNNTSFLSSQLTIEKENSRLFYYMGPGFIISGLVFYFLRKRQLLR